MAEAIVSTILEKLTALTIDKASEAWTRVRGVEKEVKRLERNFKALQLELEDAEERQYVDKSLKHWLERFTEVSYDMEDVLEDWEAAVQEMQTADQGAENSTTSVPRWKVCRPFVSCFSFGSQVVKRHDIATRIKEINEELDQIVEDKTKFQLMKREMIKQPKRPESTAFVDVSKLLGRDDVKEEIIKTLLGGTSEEEGSTCIPTISIVGMGGLGKTTLAQMIYNDDRIQTHFDKKIWVCVSDPFDQRKIAREILEDLGLGSTISLTTPLQTLSSKIRENIKEKKFLLILDDVWIDQGQDWEQLKAIFQSLTSGSMILVTTRKESVVKHIESSGIFPLEKLSDYICWRILSQKAFAGRNNISCENLEDIGRKIAEKCKGLPLAAVTLGGLLQGKLQREEWQNVLNSEIWKLDFAQQYIFTPLLLSYSDLPSAIRRCLSYCAIFHKDKAIDKDQLIQFWMAQGYLNPDDHLKGEDYFNCLATRSFFQEFSSRYVDPEKITCKMHDIVHDFVMFLTEYQFVIEDKVEDLTLDLSCKNPRHLKLVIEKLSSSPMSIYGVEKLRSLVAVSGGFGINIETLQDLLSQSKHLRLLEFQFLQSDIQKLPRDIGKLIHLRYLSLVFCGVTNLPEAVCALTNLQSLNLVYCHVFKKLPVGIAKLINLRHLHIKSCPKLEKLPDGIGKLINLRYLCNVGCNRLTYFPKGIGKLTSLKRLGPIRMRADGNDADQFSIGDLENLDLLSGYLAVQLIGDGIDWNEAKRAKLHDKIHLKRIHMSIHSPNIKKEEVVQGLNPPSNLHVELSDYLPVPEFGLSELVMEATDHWRFHDGGDRPIV